MPITTTPPSVSPTAAEFGQLRAFLAQNGVAQAEIDAAVGKTISKRTRAFIAEQLRDWLSLRPKAEQ
jgi:hypothetical protein